MKWRRLLAVVCGLGVLLFAIIQEMPAPTETPPTVVEQTSPASVALESLAVKGRAPKTDYSREQFGSGWARVNGCDTRNIILYRDLQAPQLDNECRVVGGTLNDPYTGRVIVFHKETSGDIQIDHVVALSDAWQKGAQLLTRATRVRLANDPLELIAVDGAANQQKGDSDAASWLPDNKAFRCEYVARQIAIKQKYQLWVTAAERDTIKAVLNQCPDQQVPAK